jgi:hypothetical protein
MNEWLAWIERGARAARERRLEHAPALKQAADVGALEPAARAGVPKQGDPPADTAFAR